MAELSPAVWGLRTARPDHNIARVEGFRVIFGFRGDLGYLDKGVR